MPIKYMSCHSRVDNEKSKSCMGKEDSCRSLTYRYNVVTHLVVKLHHGKLFNAVTGRL